MKRAALACALFVVLLASPARAVSPLSVAADAPTPDTRPPSNPDCLAPIANDPEHESQYPGFFNGIGAPCRYWEAQIHTSLDTNRTFTQTIDLARALTWTEYFKIVLRLRMGYSALVEGGPFALDGPIASIGARHLSYTGNKAFEVGLRVIPNWSGPNNSDPRMQRLAFGAAISSSIADDAMWLPLANFGAQVYLQFDSRSHPWTSHGATLLAGLRWLARGSLAPMQVATWLGPQNAFVGNVAFELYAGAPRLAYTDLDLQLGVHAEVSLSSIWQGAELLPVLVDGFVGWSPKTFFALRAFVGAGFSPLETEYATTHFGARVEFYVP